MLRADEEGNGQRSACRMGWVAIGFMLQGPFAYGELKEELSLQPILFPA